MEGVESTLRAMLQGRRKTWTVIILIGGALLVLGLPAADDYIALRQRERELTAALRAEQNQLQRREHLDGRAAQVDATLAQLTNRGLTDTTENDFRSAIVELTRGSNCQLRRLNFEAANYRPWLDEDHPLKPAEKGRNRKKMEKAGSGFDLRSQTILLTVSGTVADIHRLLDSLTNTGKLIHTHHVNIRPVGSDRTSAVMELQFTIFGLTKAKPKPAA
jgi:hypothetical protein